MDALHDPLHSTWLHIGNQLGDSVPDYVMQHQLPDEKQAADTPDRLYADPARRLYPIDSPAATWLSAVYLHKSAEKLDMKPAELNYVNSIIHKAAEAYGISEDVKTAISMLTTEEKQAADSNEDNWGWVMRDKVSGEVVGRKYPMFDATGVKKASAYFAENRAKYPGFVRKTIARKIMAKSAEYGVSGLDDTVRREAGFGIPRVDVLMDELYERAAMAKDAEAAVMLANVNEMIAGLPAAEIAPHLDKIAAVIEDFDRSEDMHHHYGTRLLMPADFLYDVNLEKAAEALDDAVELNQHVFSLNKLAELGPDIYREVLGDWFANDIVDGSGQIVQEKMADALYSLPKPDKAALETYLQRSCS